MDNSLFCREVYSIVREVPPGKVITYGQIACLIGKPRCSRMVGRALCHAPSQAGLPCHRVVNSQGRVAPSWPGQREKLEAEGVVFRKNGCVDLKKHLFLTNADFV